MDRLRVLNLCPECPFPPHGGFPIRQYNLIKHLSERHEIDILCFASDERRMKGIEEMRRFCRRAECLPLPSARGIQHVAKGLLGFVPYQGAMHFDARLWKEFQRFQQESEYDVIQIDYSLLVRYRNAILAHNRAALILSEQDTYSSKYFRDAQTPSNPFRRMYAFRESLRWTREELRYFPKFDCVLVPSKQSADDLSKRFPDLHVEVVENGADTEHILACNHDDEQSLCFTGGLQYAPNSDGVAFFLREIFGKIAKQHPRVRFSVVGMNPPEWLIAEGKRDPRIEVTGYVESVEPYVKAAAVFVVPLLAGGGTRLKILEAFAFGKAVVSTSVGAEGIECVNGEHIILADTPEQFASAVNRLLDDKSLRQRLGRTARQLVEQRYSWQSIAAKLESIWLQCAASRSAR